MTCTPTSPPSVADSSWHVITCSPVTLVVLNDTDAPDAAVIQDPPWLKLNWTLNCMLPVLEPSTAWE